MSKVGINNFVRRQTAKSEFSWSLQTWESLAESVEFAIAKGKFKPGYRDGVLLVEATPGTLRTSIVPITADNAEAIDTEFKARRDGEAPFAQQTLHLDFHVAVDYVARSGEIVVYRSDVLGDDASTDCEWEIVSINASPTETPTPMHPTAMARNLLEREGGTAGEFTPEQFAESIEFWSNHVQVAGRVE